MYKVLAPVYQPVVDLHTGQVAYYEALARHVDGVDGGHGRLIELGESYGFIHLIDLGILDQVLRMLAARPCVRVGVNISVMTIEKAMGDVLSLCFRYLDVIDRLVFEITETVKVSDFDLIRQFVEAVRIAKGQIAVDDLWDGHASFDLVQRLRPDYVKTAGSVIDDLVKSSNPRWMTTLKQLVLSWGGAVIVENIDRDDKLDILRRAGIQFGQGFLLGMQEAVPNCICGGCRDLRATDRARCRVSRETVIARG